MLLRAIDRKALRDVRQMRSQLAAIALVMACGLGLFLGMRTTMHSLDAARAHYYAQERFADVFATLKRAPEAVAQRLRAIPGVDRLQTRVVAAVTLDVPGMREAVTGRLVSIPDHGLATLNGVRLRKGRMPATGQRSEVLVSEAFAQAHGLVPGDRVGAVIRGRWESLRIAGIALSPEYTYALGPGTLFPDDRRFGVLWMRREMLASAFDMDGAFNDVSFRLARGASTRAVIEQVDALLERYGGIGAIDRMDQPSAFFVDNELKQLKSFGTMIPVVFLAVSAFLLHIVVGRIVAGQRTQIAALKALGYRDREVGAHYAKQIGAVVALGSVLGVSLAGWIGSSMTGLYAEFYRFPELPYHMRLADVVIGVGLALLGAGLGGAASVRHTIALPPAEALRPPAPASYRTTVLERLGLARWIPAPARIVLREVERRPLRSALSVIGIALSAALLVLSSFSYGSIQYLMNVQFGLTQREDVQLALVEPRATRAIAEIELLPGVLHAEPFRSVAVRLRNGSRARNASITGMQRGVTLQAVLDTDLQPLRIPAAGIVLSRKLAERLGVRTGGQVRVEVLQGQRPVRDVTVSRIAETFVGTAAYMDLGALSSLLQEAPALSGAWLTVDESRLDLLHAAVKSTPAIAGIQSKGRSLESLKKILDENLGTSLAFSVGFSLVMAMGVLYNAARIALAERARDLASLRVLGFRRSEVAAILVGELTLLTAVALPLGLWLGHVLAAALVNSPGFDTEQFRVPLLIAPWTDALAVATVAVAAAVSAWSTWRRLDRIDLVEVLKTGD